MHASILVFVPPTRPHKPRRGCGPTFHLSPQRTDAAFFISVCVLLSTKAPTSDSQNPLLHPLNPAKPTAGDLDPSSSTHHLVSLKTAYLKLHHLLDAGCVFVGHGLKQDFRIINLTVPPEQVGFVILRVLFLLLFFWDFGLPHTTINLTVPGRVGNQGVCVRAYICDADRRCGGRRVCGWEGGREGWLASRALASPGLP